MLIYIQTESYDANKNVTIFEYDKNNRVVETKRESNKGEHIGTTSKIYDLSGNISSSTDEKNNTTKYEYDEFDRLTKVINALNEETSYTYDLNGNMLTQTDGRDYTTTYEYNVANLLVKRSDHGGRTGTEGNYTYLPEKTVSYEYFSDGSLREMVDRNGITATYAYDVHGRLEEETVGTLEISYTYDENGNQLTITDDTGTTSRVYDELGRVTSKTVPNIGTTTFNYDIIYDESQGYVAEVVTDPKGNQTTKVYDRAGRLKFVVDEEDTTEYTYYPDGRRESLEYPDGSRQEYKYYDSGLLHILTNKKADGSTMDTYTYKYDAAGNQLEKVEYINGVNKGKTSYTYDDLNRLETVTEPSGRFTEYTYDESGNRETETISFNGKTTVNTYTNNEQNRLEEVETQVDGSLTETTVYTYDNNGNQLTVTTNGSRVISNTYDDKNQLIRTQANGKTVVNTYNGEGLRVAKSVNGSLTRYLYEYDKVVLEVNGSGKEIARNLYGTNLLMRTVEGESYYYMYNGHADVTALINVETGTIDATYYYDAFGNILESTGDVNNNITYAGYQYDEETGLYYCNARMYDPKVARFLQEDTYRGDPNDPLSLNLYVYGHNNPITYYDPTGHFVNLVSGAIGAGVGFIIGAGVSMVSDAIKGELSRDNWRKYVGAGAQGAIVGGVAGLTAGLGLGVVATTGIGLGAGAAGNTANQVIRNEGFDDFSVKELAVSSIASGAGFGVGKLVSNATASVTSNISSQAMQQTAQGAMVGGAAGSSGSFAANVTDQVIDLARGETDEGKAKENFDFGSLAKDTLIGGTTGAFMGAAFGYGSSKYGAKISKLDQKVNNSIRQTTNKLIDASKQRFSRVLKDQSGSVKFGEKGNSNTGVGGNGFNKQTVLDNIAESKAARQSSNFGKPSQINPGDRTLEGFVNNHVSPQAEVGLYTKSAGFNNNRITGTGEQFKRFGADEHFGLKPHVHQPVRNINPKTGEIFGRQGKTVGVDVFSPSVKDVKQLYDYFYNGKYLP